MISFFCTRNVLNGHNKQIISDEKVEYIKVFDAVKMENKVENTSVMPTKTKWSNINSEVDRKESADNSCNEHFRKFESDNNSILSIIKIEETDIGNIQKPENKVKRKRKNKDFRCSTCGHEAKTSSSLYYHKRQNHSTEDDFVKCQFCSYKHFCKHTVMHHIKKYHKELIKTLKAETGQKMKTSKTNKQASTSSVSKQMRLQDKEEEESLSDNNMSLTKSPSSFNEEIEQNRELFSDEEFIRKMLNMTKKIRTKISKLKAKKKECDVCGKMFNSYNAWSSHKLMHLTEEEKLACPHCEKRFTRTYNLKSHIKIQHSFENKFICTHCSFEAPTQWQLEVHMRMYHTERAFECDICKKKFLNRTHLKQHTEKHSGLTYKCDICSKSFSCRSYMIAHRHLHDRKKQPCKDCGNMYLDMKHHIKVCSARKN